jgi:hypothetical protein
VLYPGLENGAPVVALCSRSTGDSLGQSSAIVFEDGDPAKPIIIGMLRNDHHSVNDEASTVDVEVDGERLLITAREQIALRCGLASITPPRLARC